MRRKSSSSRIQIQLLLLLSLGGTAASTETEQLLSAALTAWWSHLAHIFVWLTMTSDCTDV